MFNMHSMYKTPIYVHVHLLYVQTLLQCEESDTLTPPGCTDGSATAYSPRLCCSVVQNQCMYCAVIIHYTVHCSVFPSSILHTVDKESSYDALCEDRPVHCSALLAVIMQYSAVQCNAT